MADEDEWESFVDSLLNDLQRLSRLLASAIDEVESAVGALEDSDEFDGATIEQLRTLAGRLRKLSRSVKPR